VLLAGAPVRAASVSFSAQQIISAVANGANSVFVVDVDGDTDLDVLSASFWDSKIAWYENVDGLGTFGSEQVITTMASDARAVFAADLDGDGDVDVLSASSFDNTIAWYENTDGLGTFGPRQTIENQASEARAVIAADLDGDSDMDVLSASLADDTIAWYENTDGMGTFGPQRPISTVVEAAISVFAADMDLDGDFDVISGSLGDEIFWHPNLDGAGSFGPPQLISAAGDGTLSVFVADLDGDGDPDIAAASNFDDEISWYENLLAISVPAVSTAGLFLLAALLVCCAAFGILRNPAVGARSCADPPTSGR